MATNNSLNINSSTPLDLATGGTNGSLSASNGGIVYSNATAMAVLAGTATANQLLMSGSSTTPAWSAATYLSSLTANSLFYASAANVMNELAPTNSAVLVSTSGGIPAWSGSLNSGEIIIGAIGGIPAAATITPGGGISIVNGINSITISSTGGGIAWVDQTSTPVTAAIDTGYIVDNGAVQVVFTLPIAPALGSSVGIVGSSSGGWQVLPGAGDTIQIGSVTAATSVTSANQYDCLTLIYNGGTLNQWIMVSSVTAGFVIV